MIGSYQINNESIIDDCPLSINIECVVIVSVLISIHPSRRPFRSSLFFSLTLSLPTYLPSSFLTTPSSSPFSPFPASILLPHRLSISIYLSPKITNPDIVHCVRALEVRPAEFYNNSKEAQVATQTLQ